MHTKVLAISLLSLLLLSYGVEGVTFAGCFTAPPGNTGATDIVALGWSDRYEITPGAFSRQFCVNHCVQKNKKYAGISQEGSKPAVCVCGDNDAYKRLGTEVHKEFNAPCNNPVWNFRVFVALGDSKTQYLGCYKEVKDGNNLASGSHLWIDTWTMNPKMCITYCFNNQAAYAALREGDTCTCGYTFAKHGKVDESACNKPCVSSAGEICGGSEANSVYSTISHEEILNPSTSMNRLNNVKIPNTQNLLKSLIEMQAANDNQVAAKETRTIGDQMNQAIHVMQSVLEMKQPLNDLKISQGFSISNSAETRNWLAKPFPNELDNYVKTIRAAHSFIDQDVQRLLRFIDEIEKTTPAIKQAIIDTLNKLENYMKHGITITGVDRTMVVVHLMVSAVVDCMPYMNANRDLLLQNIEGVSKELVESPHGTKAYMQTLKYPFFNVNFQAPPTIDTQAWKNEITNIGNVWADFIQNNAVALYQLAHTTYTVSCTNPNAAIGKRACTNGTEDLDFFTLVKRSGDNKAKEDMSNFIASAQQEFDRFNWDTLRNKIDAIWKTFQDVKQYLSANKFTDPNKIRAIGDKLTSYQFYQTCVDMMNNMIRDTCLINENPNHSQVRPIKC